MQGAVDGALVLSGHTGAGPGSVVAVYRSVRDNESACCAVFREDANEGAAEAEVVRHLLATFTTKTT
ncbi:hypothetical protein D3C86_2247260 [compost metagenome]